MFISYSYSQKISWYCDWEKFIGGKKIYMDLAFALFVKLLQIIGHFTNISKHIAYYCTIKFECIDFSYQKKAQ